jgi:putative ABC transport system permease protein
MEASIIGCAGTIIGTSIGLLVSGYFQTHGVDLSSYSTNSTLLFENIIYTKITPTCWFIGFIPGLAAVIAGAMLAGISIYQRKTSQLFKELEA